MLVHNNGYIRPCVLISKSKCFVIFIPEVIKTLLRGPHMGFPWGTLNPDITGPMELFSSFIPAEMTRLV